MESREDLCRLFLNIVKSETVPAIGCTEPVAVAYASAVAKKYLTGDIDSIKANVSINIYKNGKSVTIPNTDKCGLELAVTLGAICGDPNAGLLVFKNVDESNINSAYEMINQGKVDINWIPNTPEIYVQVLMSSKENTVEVVLKDNHNHIESVKVNGELVYHNILKTQEKKESDILKSMTFREIREVCENVPLSELDFIEEGIKMNKAAAFKGLTAHKGLNWGAAIGRLQKKGKLTSDASMKARILTAAGADIRMGGGNCPIMTSAGSGNQGLGVILPIAVVAEEENIDREKLLRAVLYGHLLNKFVKVYTGKLTAICGCAIAAGIGATSSIAWMLGGNDKQIEGAAQNMFANLAGILCDGAKETCALKLSTSAGEAVLSAYLACDDVIAKCNTGILGGTIEETIRNIGTLCKKGFSGADEVIVDIIG